MSQILENNILDGESIEEHAFRMFHEIALRNEETERSGSTGGDPLIHIYTLSPLKKLSINILDDKFDSKNMYNTICINKK